MLTFENTPHSKQFFTDRLQAHMDADELIRGTGYEDGRGCAVGCLLNKYDHKLFESEMGISEWLPRLMDYLHENTSDDYWPTFTKRCFSAIGEGVDIDDIKNPLLARMQRRNLKRVRELAISTNLKNEVCAAIKDVIQWLESDDTSSESAEFAEFAARSAAQSAQSAQSAARSAWSAQSAQTAAQSAAQSAARSAAQSAESAEFAEFAARSAQFAARSARFAEFAQFAARSAAQSAAQSASQSAAQSAARSAALDQIANDLIELLQGQQCAS